MLKTDQIHEVHRLARGEHWSMRRIARHLHLGTRTVKKYLFAPVPAPVHRPRPSKLDPFKPLIAELLEQDARAPGSVILQRLQAAGYTGGHSILREYLQQARGSSSAPRAFVRMEPAAGERFEIDWGHFGALDYQGDQRKLYAFGLIEAHSRMLYVEFTHSQSFETFVRCHQHAFEALGGVARECWYDNLLTVVAEHDGRLIHFNPRFLAFAREYGLMNIKLDQANKRRYSEAMNTNNRLKRKRIMTVNEFRLQFGDEAQCEKYLTEQRWPQGFVCPRCGGRSRGYLVGRRLHECAACGYQCSITAGTIFHKTRVPLRSWFWALYRMSQDKKGLSALQLSKEIDVSYPTAWLMQHKIRKAMADRDQRYQLKGLIEVDEGYVGGKEEGIERKGRGALTKSVVVVAVEHAGPGVEDPKPIPGFAALAVLPDASAGSLQGFVQAKAQAGSRLLSDGWPGYRGLEQRGFQHTALPLRGDPKAAHRLFPWVHITLSNLKRFLLGTHHKVEPRHLPRYVAEFAYRLNRRTMERDLFQRLVRACLATDTIIYKDLTTLPELA